MPGSTEEIRCPDMSYVEPARLAAMPVRGSYRVGAPDLVIEIASPPGDTHPEMDAKAQDYLKAGVQLVWMVWPYSQTTDVWTPSAPNRPLVILQSTDMLDGQQVIPDFQCRVKDI
jgi:Uma2 family endonuclease